MRVMRADRAEQRVRTAEAPPTKRSVQLFRDWDWVTGA